MAEPEVMESVTEAFTESAVVYTTSEWSDQPVYQLRPKEWQIGSSLR